MKKIVAILLIPIFLLMTAGMAITSLYCNGAISEVGIYVKPCCKDVNKGGCCKTTSKIVKVEDSFHSTSKLFEFKTIKVIDACIPGIQIQDQALLLQTRHFTTYSDTSPPLIQRALYLLFCTLLI